MATLRAAGQYPLPGWHASSGCRQCRETRDHLRANIFSSFCIPLIQASESLHCSGVLGPISTRWLDEQRIVGFPHPHVPSDHVPLLATLHVPMLDALCQKAVTRQRRHESIALAVVPSSVSSKSPGKRNPASVLLDSPIPSGVAPVEPIRPTIGSVASSDADEDGLDSPTDEDDDNDSPLASSEEL